MNSGCDMLTIPLQGKLVMSYGSESNLAHFPICAFLPKAQPEMALSGLHISYLLQKCKKGKPRQTDLPL